MDLTEKDIYKIIELVRQADFGEFHLEMREMKLVVIKGERRDDDNLGDAAFQRRKLAEPEQLKNSDAGQETETINSQNGIDLKTLEDDGLFIIRSPIIGAFYRCPGPGEPPFVEIGDSIDVDSTVCLIETMKVFNSVKAKVTGYIERVLVDDGEFVEFGAPLFGVIPLEE